MDSLEDYILNEDKIVTYRWLSKTLNIHTNTSKQLLYTFSLNNREKNLSVTYLISGCTQDGDEKVFVVPESGVDKVKSSLDSVLSEHVYSVQKASSKLSSSDLYLADSSAPVSENKSSISSRKVEEREFKIIVPEKPSSSKLQPNKCAEDYPMDVDKEIPFSIQQKPVHKTPVGQMKKQTKPRNPKRKWKDSHSIKESKLRDKYSKCSKTEPKDEEYKDKQKNSIETYFPKK